MTRLAMAGQVVVALMLVASPLEAQSKAVSMADKANALAQSVRSILCSPGESALREAERLTAELDAMPSSVAKQQAEAHVLVGSRHRGNDNEDEVLRHYTRALDLARQLSDEEGLSLEVAAAANLAGVYANRGDVHRALAILASAAARVHTSKLAQTPESEMLARFLAAQQARYSMVGLPAPTIVGKHWLNSPPGTTSLAMKGKVRILAFVAFWCDPCANSYPGLKRLAAEFPASDFEVVFATRLYGEVGGQRTPVDAELTQLRNNFLTLHQIPYPIAVEEQPVGPRVESLWMATLSTNERSYRVSGLPEFLVIDRGGVIRRIVFAGWDPANEPGLREMIRRLLERAD
jgi:hypothetical protein